MCNGNTYSLRRLNDDDFNDYIQHDCVLVLVVSNGCRYAYAQRRILSELEFEYPQFFMSYYDMSSHPDAAITYDVRVTPTLLLFRHGVLSDRVAGFRTTEELEDLFVTWQKAKKD